MQKLFTRLFRQDRNHNPPNQESPGEQSGTDGQSRGHQDPKAGPQADSPAGSGSWVGVDLDGTLAIWDSGSTLARIGKPVPAMLDFVKRMVDSGIRVKVFTARAGDPRQIPKIHKWLKSNGLPQLEVTNVKDYRMQKLYDDRCIQVEKNTGRIISDL